MITYDRKVVQLYVSLSDSFATAFVNPWAKSKISTYYGTVHSFTTNETILTKQYSFH